MSGTHRASAPREELLDPELPAYLLGVGVGVGVLVASLQVVHVYTTAVDRTAGAETVRPGCDWHILNARALPHLGRTVTQGGL